MSDTELQQLIIYVGTTAKIDAAQQAGIITENDLAISTDAPEYQTLLTAANAGEGIAITNVNGVVKITNTREDATWGHINGDINDQLDLQEALAGKQNVIVDLSTIRAGAALGATAVQPSSLSTVATSGSYNDLLNKPTIGNATLTIQKNSTNVGTFTANATSNKSINITVPTKTSDLNNDSGFLTTNDIINNTTSSATDKPLSANMGKSLQDQIDNMNGRGRFLALWNCATGLAQTNPPQTTYTYKAGDYFIVGTVAQSGGTNYRPSGSSYTTGVPSTVVETEDVAVNDVYYYDGTTWALQINTQKEVSFVNIAGDPYDNTNLASALNAKQDELVEGTGIDIDSSTNTISNSGVRSVTTGSSNGTISVNTGGTTENVSVYGLGSAAYTPTTDYATAGQGTKADSALQPNDNISLLNNNAGYITGITSSDVTTALGFTPIQYAMVITDYTT